MLHKDEPQGQTDQNPSARGARERAHPVDRYPIGG